MVISLNAYVLLKPFSGIDFNCPFSGKATSLSLLQFEYALSPSVVRLSGKFTLSILLYAKPSSPTFVSPSLSTTSPLLEYAKAAVPIVFVDASTVYVPASPAG